MGRAVGILAIWGVLCLTTAQAQRPQDSVFLNPAKPGVYISFLRLGPREPLRVDESKRGAFFRVHNNTRWQLLLHIFGAPTRNGDAGIFYEVVEDPAGYPPSRLPVGERMIDISSVNPLRPGESIAFSVPVEHIAEGLGIQVRFNYGWEAREPTGIPRSSEPEHLTTFYHSQLPEALRRGERRRPFQGEASTSPPAIPVPSALPTQLDEGPPAKGK